MIFGVVKFGMLRVVKFDAFFVVDFGSFGNFWGFWVDILADGVFDFGSFGIVKF